MDLRHFGRLVPLYLIVIFRTSISNGPKWTPIFPAFDWDHLAKIQHHGWKKKPLKLLISIWKRKVQLLQSGEILHRRLYWGGGGGRGTKLPPPKKRPCKTSSLCRAKFSLSLNDWVKKLYFYTVVISRYKIAWLDKERENLVTWYKFTFGVCRKRDSE